MRNDPAAKNPVFAAKSKHAAPGCGKVNSEYMNLFAGASFGKQISGSSPPGNDGAYPRSCERYPVIPKP
jgi:hypothetical protein